MGGNVVDLGGGGGGGGGDVERGVVCTPGPQENLDHFWCINNQVNLNSAVGS